MAAFIYLYSVLATEAFSNRLYKHLTSAFNVNIKRLQNNFLHITIPIPISIAITTIIIIIITLLLLLRPLLLFCKHTALDHCFGNFPAPVFTAIGSTEYPALVLYSWIWMDFI